MEVEPPAVIVMATDPFGVFKGDFEGEVMAVCADCAISHQQDLFNVCVNACREIWPWIKDTIGNNVHIMPYRKQ